MPCRHNNTGGTVSLFRMVIYGYGNDTLLVNINSGRQENDHKRTCKERGLKELIAMGVGGMVGGGIFFVLGLSVALSGHAVHHLLESFVLLLFLGINLYGVKAAGKSEDVIVMVKILILSLFAAINLSAIRLRTQIGLNAVIPLLGLLLTLASWVVLSVYLYRTTLKGLAWIGAIYLCVIISKLCFSERKLFLKPKVQGKADKR